MDHLNVMVVEDNQTFRQALIEILKSQYPRMIIEEAADGAEALKKIKAFLPALVFMDIKLPGASGLEITRKIKAQYAETVVIILTSYDLPEYREAAMKYGANHFIVKGSSTFEEISSLIEKVAANPTAHLPRVH